MCSMSLTRQMQCNITCLYFAARGSEQNLHLTTAHVLAKSTLGIVILKFCVKLKQTILCVSLKAPNMLTFDRVVFLIYHP